MTIVINAYKNGSASAKALAAELGCKVLLKKGSKFRGKAGDTIINWGSSENIDPKVAGIAKVFNDPAAVGSASNKLHTQQKLLAAGNPYMIPWTTNLEQAKAWIRDGEVVVCREKLTGHSGQGIVMAAKEEDLVRAPLYTMYKKKVHEYRVHVMDGEIIDVQRKARRKEVPDNEVNWQVRNLDGGFVFARENVVAPVEVCKAALITCRDLGLFNGAIDIGCNNRGQQVFVYEANTACGLAGSTLINYANAYRRALGLIVKAAIVGHIPMAKQPIALIDEAVNGGAPDNDGFQVEPAPEPEQPLRVKVRQQHPELFPEPALERGGDVDMAAMPKAWPKQRAQDGLHIKHGNIDAFIPKDKMGDVVVALMEKGLI